MRHTRMTTVLAHGLILILLVLFIGKSVWAGEDDKKADDPRSRFGLGVGGGYGRFDTNFKFTHKDSGASVFVDGEGTLGL